MVAGEVGVRANKASAPKHVGIRKRVANCMSKSSFHHTIIIFVIADLLLVFAELVVDGYTCHGEHNPELVQAEEIIGYISFSILSLFVVEVGLRVWAIGVCKFIRDWVNVMDFFVILLSFLVEIVLKYAYRKLAPVFQKIANTSHNHVDPGAGEDSEEYPPANMAILKVFQILRMLHAVVHGIEMKAHAQIEQIAIAKQEVEDETDQLKLKIVSLTHQLKRKRVELY